MAKCPLVDRDIESGDCLEITEVVDEMVGNESYIPDEFKKKNNYKEICKKCKQHVSAWGEPDNK